MMAEDSPDPQVVFLVDLSTCRQKGSKWDEAISLFVFRTLCFFNCQLRSSGSKDKPNKNVLKWGYKFLDIDEKDLKVGSMSPSFKDFKLKSFEEFERNLKNLVQSQQQTTSSTPETKRQPTNKTRKGLTVSAYPARRLSQCLTETLHDFQWEWLDIGSPVKSRKRQSWSDQNKTSSNYVFLISRVPSDRKTLRHFSNKVVMDKDVFLESFMSQALQKEFCDQRKIHLYWVDCGRYQVPSNTNTVPPEKKSFEIVEQSLSSLGGALVPFQSLVTHLTAVNQQRHFAEVTASGTNGRDSEVSDVCADGKKQSGTERDEFAVVLSSFSCMSACTALMKPSTIQESSVNICGQQKEGPVGVKLVISGKDTDGSTYVVLRLVPVKEIESARSRTGRDQCEVQLHTGTDHCSYLLKSHRKAQRIPQPSAVTQLEVRGFMEKADVRKLGANLGSHSVCFVSENAPLDQHSAFSALLAIVHSRCQTLVLSIKADNKPSPHLALLEAASASTAHLSYLSLATTLQVEKVMVLPTLQDGNVETADPAIGRSALQAFKDRAVKAIMTLPIRSDQVDQSREVQGLWTGAMNPWHVVGSVSQLQSAMDYVTNRIAEAGCGAQAQEEAELGNLQQTYRQESQTPSLLQNTPLTNTSTPFPALSRNTSADRSKTASADRSREDGSGSESRSSLRRESSFLARGKLMVSKAKLALDEVDGACTPRVTSEAQPKLDVSHVDVKSVEDLQQYLQDAYDKVLETGLGLESAVQSMVSVSQHFMASQPDSSACPQKSAVEFLREKTLKSCKELKEHYQNLVSEEDGRSKITEFKLQILLRLEMESVYSIVDHSQQDLTANQVVELLRSLLFAADAVEVPLFLSNIILTNYVSTLPQLLVTVYDELVQPLPDALAAFGSPGTATPSVSHGPLSASSLRSVGPDSAHSAPPGSNQSTHSIKTRARSSLRSHPSLTGQGTKRQIVVQPSMVSRAKVEVKGKVKAERKSPRKSPGKHLVEKVNPEAKKARRNLFNTQTGSKKEDAEKRKTTPKKKRHSSSPSKKSKGSKTFVAETPRHRQRSRLAWRREQVTKYLSRSGPPEVQVIEESPLKQIAQLKDSPGCYKPARRIVRQSFYSAGRGNRSRNLARALELSSRIAGRHHHRHEHLKEFPGGRLSDAIKSTNDVTANMDREDLLSPRRRKAAFLRAQLMRDASSSPDLLSPSHNTRSKTPQRTPRQRLFVDDGPSLPAWSSSVVSRLDFTSPVKQTSSQGSSSMLVAETPPRGGSFRGSLLLVGDTPTKEAGETGHITPVKFRGHAHGHVTPVKAKSVSPMKGRAGTCHVTPVKGRAGTSGHVTPVKGRAGTSGHMTSMKSGSNHVSPSKDSGGTSGHVTPVKSRANTSDSVSPLKGWTGTSSHGTPVKVRAGSSSQVTTSKEETMPGTSGYEVTSTTPQKDIRVPPPSQRTPRKSLPWLAAAASRGMGSDEAQASRTLAKKKGSSINTTSPKKGERETDTGKGKIGRKGGSRTSRRLKGVSPTHSSSSSSSSSQQSSILDYVSPTRKPSSQGNSLADLSSPPRSSKRIFSRDDLSPHSKHALETQVRSSFGKRSGRGLAPATSSEVRPGPSGTLRTPTKSRPEFSSPTKSRFIDITSPTKTNLEFVSPTKTAVVFTSPNFSRTPTKPILKSSPYFQSGQSSGTSNRTPEKSPRVSFNVARTRRDSRTPSPTSGDGSRVKTPDSIDKWRRRKRRWTGENSSKFPSLLDAVGDKGGSSLSSELEGFQSDSLCASDHHAQQTMPKNKKIRVSLLCLEKVDEDANSGVTLTASSSRKRSSSVFLETGAGVASPRKKRKTEASGLGNATSSIISQPVSFSENAVDGYFSTSNDDVLLETSSVPSAEQSPELFPMQKDQLQSPQFKVRCSQGPGLVRCKSTFSSEGSQGFDITAGSKDNEPPPSSPVFTTSPVLHDLRTKDSIQFHRKSAGGRLSLVRDIGHTTVYSGSKSKGKGKSVSHTLSRADIEQQQISTSSEKGKAGEVASSWSRPEESESLQTETPPRQGGTSRSSETSPSGRLLTPLRVKGTPTDRKYSPIVSTSSLVQLMSSPLLLAKEDLDSTSPKSKRTRKKLRKMPPFLE